MLKVFVKNLAGFLIPHLSLDVDANGNHTLIPESVVKVVHEADLFVSGANGAVQKFVTELTPGAPAASQPAPPATGSAPVVLPAPAPLTPAQIQAEIARLSALLPAPQAASAAPASPPILPTPTKA